MRFLALNSDMSNFSAHGDTIKWELSNLELNANGKFAISNMVIIMNDIPTGEKFMISTSLVERDENNSDGVVISKPVRGKFISYQATVLEYWNLDSSRPRNIMFTLRGLDESMLSFVSVVIVFD